MADNRLFLIHQPTKLGVLIGKRMGGDVYNPNNGECLESFYEMVTNSGEDLDDFVMFNEETNYGEPWEYTTEHVNGFRLFMRKV